MRVWKSESQLLPGMSITTKLGLGIGLLLALIVTVAATGYLSIQLVRDAEESIQISTEIQRLVLEMDRGMEKARRLHGDFFLHYPQIGLSKAHEQYTEPSVRQIAQVIEVSNVLRDRIAQSGVSTALRESRVDLNLYLSSAKRFADTSIQSVDLVTRLAASGSGLEAELEDRLAVLWSQIVEVERLRQLHGEMQSFVQVYRISRKRHYMQSAFNAAFRLREETGNAAALSAERKEKINRWIDQCLATAEKILEIDVAVKSKFNDFALQTEAADTVSTTLVELAREEVEQARTRIGHAHRAAIIVMGATTLMGLIAAAFIAGVLNKSITRRVVRLTRCAGELRKGNLEVFAGEGGRDELSELARTFNAMASRIRELIDNLEQKVEQRTAELAVSERRFRELFEHSTSGVVVYEPYGDGEDFIFKDINKAVERIEGVRRDDVLGQRLTEVFPGVKQFGLPEILQRVWQTGESARQPAALYSDDRLEGWRENSVYKLPSGEIVAVYDDCTARKQAELEKKAMEAKLQRAKKMETVGLLAGGVAHDLNNILSGIVGYPELLLMQIPESSELRGPIKAIRESGQRAAAVVADLLTVARGVASAKTAANLNDLVREYLLSPEHARLATIHGDILCTTQLEPRLHNIHCSPVHVGKCIMNLVMNAMEAMDGGGHVVLSTYNRKVDRKTARAHTIPTGDYAVLRVTDDGRGIAKQDLEHIFEPFYTRKVMGRSGTGLGLAVVWNTAMDHNGTVLVESGTGGTSFELYFPASREEIVSDTRGVGIDALKGRGEAILVVDDEPQQRDIAARMLKLLGYEVSCVESGEKAIAYLREHRVDLVLLDMLMDPGMNGRQTYERILRIHPGQKAVIASGFSPSEDVGRAQRMGAGGFIKKPYSVEQLGGVVKKELNG